MRTVNWTKRKLRKCLGQFLQIPTDILGKSGDFGKKLSPKKATCVATSMFLSLVLFNVIDDRYFSKTSLGLEYSVLRSLPLRTYSKLLGIAARFRYPCPVNVLVLAPLKLCLGIDLAEAKRKKISEYHSFNDLFTRELAPGSRPIGAGITSPADGVIIYAGEVGDESEELKVKGVRYRENEFLGVENVSDLKKHSKSRMYQMVVYLAPNNYHRFHAFMDMHLTKVTHIESCLFSVAKTPMRYLRGLLSKNERVIFGGFSEWGYAALVAVGSTGVGSITTPHVHLQTNAYFRASPSKNVFHVNAQAKKGEEIGKFNLGSTVVLVFEAPEGFAFTASPGPVKMGASLGCGPDTYSTTGPTN